MQPEPITVQRNGFTISTDAARLDIPAIHEFLANRSYWDRDIALEIVQRAIQNSLCFGIYEDAGDWQVGFGRVITDFATMAYLCDVFVLEPFRGQGLSKWLLETILGHPALQGMKVWRLATRDAHGLYARYGFKPLRNPENAMEIYDPEIYSRMRPHNELEDEGASANLA